MNPNKEFVSSAETEVTGSSNGSFRINITLALPTCIAFIVYYIYRHHFILVNILLLMSHKIEQQHQNNKSASIQTIILPLCAQIYAVYTGWYSMAYLN